MLEFDYSKRFESLIQSLNWQIQLPPDWSTFFDEVGECLPRPDDDRQNGRMKARTQAAMISERPIPSVPRDESIIGIYSKDFSRRGCSFLSAQQLYPQESVRLILPTFWMQVSVCRARRLGTACYEIGAELIEKHGPSKAAFETMQQPHSQLA